MPMGPLEVAMRQPRQETQQYSEEKGSRTPRAMSSRVSLSLLFSCARSQHELADVTEYACQEGNETRTERAVDHAVVIRKRHRQHQARRKFLPVPHRLHDRFA